VLSIFHDSNRRCDTVTSSHLHLKPPWLDFTQYNTRHDFMCVLCPVGGSVVPVKHHSRQPAAGAGCHWSQASAHDHSPARQGVYLFNCVKDKHIMCDYCCWRTLSANMYCWHCIVLGWLRHSEGSSLGHQQPDNKWKERSGKNLLGNVHLLRDLWVEL